MHNLNVLSQMTNELTNVKVVCENEFWGGKVKYVFLFFHMGLRQWSEEGGFMTGYSVFVTNKPQETTPSKPNKDIPSLHV